MRSISSKLILAFLSIGVVSVLIIAITAVWSTRAEFIRFLTDQTQTDIVSELSDYHRTYGTWERAESIFSYGNNAAPPGMGPGHRRRQPFALANESGHIIIPNGPFRRGEILSQAELEEGIPITEDGELIGFLI
ncbi:MAG TPA: hypothetical protein VGK56_18530, partial [Anaerolineales bacterium]